MFMYTEQTSKKYFYLRLTCFEELESMAMRNLLGCYQADAKNNENIKDIINDCSKNYQETLLKMI